MNLHKKLIEIRKAVPYLQKIENNADQGFKYNSSSQVLAITRREMDKHGVLLKPDIKGHVFHHKAITKASMHHTELEMTFTWIDSENPKDTIVCDWYSQGCDQHEKGVSKALTYAEKFFILKFNNIATDKDDPDAFEKRLENGTPGTDAKTPAPGKSSNVCPKCGVQAIIKGKEEWGGGWLCFDKKGGCGEKFTEDPTKQKPAAKAPPKVAYVTAKQYADLLKAGAAMDLNTEEVGEVAAWYRKGDKMTAAEAASLIKDWDNEFNKFLEEREQYEAHGPDREA